MDPTNNQSIDINSKQTSQPQSPPVSPTPLPLPTPLPALTNDLSEHTVRKIESSSSSKDFVDLDHSTQEERDYVISLKGNEGKIIEYFKKLQEQGKAVENGNYWKSGEGERLNAKVLLAFGKFKEYLSKQKVQARLSEMEQKPLTYASKAEISRVSNLEKEIKKCKRNILEKNISEEQENAFKTEQEKLETELYNYLIGLAKSKGSHVFSDIFWLNKNGSMSPLIKSALERCTQLYSQRRQLEETDRTLQRFRGLQEKNPDGF